MGDRLQTGEPYKGLAGVVSHREELILTRPGGVTRGFMGPLGGFWPKLGRKRVTGWKQRSCVPPGRVKTNKQTNKMTSPKQSPQTIFKFRPSNSLD
jgi:hypothetical protein